MQVLQNIRSNFFISVLMIISGLVLIVWPDTSLNFAINIIGILLVLIAAFKFLMYKKNESKLDLNFQFLEIMVYLILGLTMLFFSNAIMSIFTVLFGIYICFDGLVNIKKGVELKKYGYSKYKFILVIGIILFIIGLIFIYKPSSLMNVIMILMGSACLIDGVFNLYVNYCAQALNERLDKEFKSKNIDY